MPKVLAHGVFDILHSGHVEYLRKAKELAGPDGKLIVSVTTDEHVNKGPGKPINNFYRRTEVLEALSFVDEVHINQFPTAKEIILALKPDIYVKGHEYNKGEHLNLNLEIDAIESIGGRFETIKTEVQSSSEIANKAKLGAWSGEILGYIDNFKSLGFDYQRVSEFIDAGLNYKALVLGEKILDIYQYMRARGRSAKESYITYELGEALEFYGGAWAIKNHLDGFVGEANTPDVDTQRVIIKKRFVTEPFGHKAFGIIGSDSITFPEPEDFKGISDYDFLICADFGHGYFDKGRAELLSSKEIFLALTVQANSLNWGMNTIGKWPRASYVVLDEQELRLHYRDNGTPVVDLMRELAEDINPAYIAITRGHEGCIVAQCYPDFIATEAPALSSNVVDRIGAGDAFLAVTAPLAKAKAPPQIIAFIGNIAGAIQVESLGNSKAITRREVKAWLKNLLA